MSDTSPLPINGSNPSQPDTNSDRTTLALQRLAVSRERLLRRLAPPSKVAEDASSGTGFRMPLRWRALGRMLLSRGPSAALGRAAMAALSQWWKSQPWHSSAEMLGQATMREVSPVMRRHPWLVLAAGVGLGAALFVLGPWRATGVSRYVKPLGGYMARAAWRLFGQAPVQMAIAAALAAWLGDQQRETQEPASEPPAPL
ncbi:MAG: hypothetical protein ABI434_00500 [Burkholderiaceae bacterium]